MFKVRGKRETVSYQLPFGACVCVKTVITYGILSTMQGSGEQ